jgi:acyl dehydratase
MKTLNGIEGVREAQGQEWGTSDWFEISQERVNQFADATDDHQWIHVDVERAKQGPFGTTIAHGFLTLSLVVPLAGQVSRVEGIRMGINYGVNKVRFPNPVRIPARIRAHVKNLSVEDVEGGVQVTNQVTIEVVGAEKPACVAETISRYYV